jgi:hypothetical protein
MGREVAAIDQQHTLGGGQATTTGKRREAV